MLAIGFAVARGGRAIDGVRSLWGWGRGSWLDVQLLLARQLLAALGLIPSLASSFAIAFALVRWLDGFGRPAIDAPVWLVGAAYTLALFIAWDVSRYVVHRAMHEIPALWAFHQVHHSAEVLNPLTFHRIHPLESVLYQLRGALVTGAVAGVFFWLFRGAAVEWTVLGVHGVGLVLNTVFGNLRHSHVWWSFGRWERWFVSPAQHQLHHAEHGPRVNYGTWLAVWDRLGGSLELADRPPERFGVPAAERNHGDDLLSAWFGPLRDLWPGRRVGVAAVGLVALNARAAQPDEEDIDVEVIVTQPDGTPRVAGSAHVVGEEELARFEYDDIGRVLAATPGVYVRGEDGFGLRPNLGIRGANSDRSAKITLLEDGVPFGPAPYAAPAAYYFPMATRLVGVEVFKGPAATQHGPHTVGGAINVLTRRVPVGAEGQVDLAYGQRDTAKLHAWAGAGTPTAGWLAEFAHLRTDGFKRLDGGGPTGFERSEAMLKGRLATDPSLASRHAVELKLGYASERSDETYLGLHPDDYAEDPYRRYAGSALDEMRWLRTAADLSWQVDPRPGLRIRTVAYHRWLTRDWTKFNRFAGGPDPHVLLQQPEAGQSAVFLAVLRGQEDSATPEQALRIGTNARAFHSAGVQSRVRWRVRSDRVDSQLEAGVRVHTDLVDRLHTEDPHDMRSGVLVRNGDPTLTLLDARATATAIAAHVHEDLAIGRVHVLPGVRSETVWTTFAPADGEVASALRSVVLPGLAVLVEPVQRVQLFAGAHRGFSPVAPGQPLEVRPERSWNVEGGARVGGPTTRAELVGFVNAYENLTGQCTISGGCLGELVDRQFNGGRVSVAGVEGVAAHELLLPKQFRLPVQASYTFTRGRFLTGFQSGFPQFGTVSVGDGLPYVPSHQAGARIALVHPRFSVALGGVSRSGMRDSAGQGPLGPGDVPTLTLIDAAADVTLADGLVLYTTVVNATNRRALESWRPFGARPTAPLQAMLGVKVSP